LDRIVEAAVHTGLETALYADRNREIVPPPGYDRGNYGAIESCVDDAVRAALIAYFRRKVAEYDES
jgi:hypothetical protein